MANITDAITFYKDILGLNISRGFEPLIGEGTNRLASLGVFSVFRRILLGLPLLGTVILRRDASTMSTMILPEKRLSGQLWMSALDNQSSSWVIWRGVLKKVKNNGQVVVIPGGEPIAID